jgi:hypothetical protein
MDCALLKTWVVRKAEVFHQNLQILRFLILKVYIYIWKLYGYE